jgi:hypothetical protein
MLESNVTLRDIQSRKSTLQLAQEVMLGQLRERMKAQLIGAGELALTGLLNSFGSGPRDYDRRDPNLREQAALHDQRQALAQQGKVQGYELALGCIEMHPPQCRESLDAYARRLEEAVHKECLTHVNKAGELALHAIAFSASHPEYGPARAAAVRAASVGDGLREALCVAIDTLQGILKQDEEAQAAKTSR